MTFSNPLPRSRRHRARSVSIILTLAVLLVLPILALTRAAVWIDGWVLAGAAVILSVFTFLAHRSDKRRAEAGAWRVPEGMLHLAELLGGWPGAWLAQRFLRHKTAKLSYQFVFWLIILLHQGLALDSLLDWRFIRLLLGALKSHIN